MSAAAAAAALAPLEQVEQQLTASTLLFKTPQSELDGQVFRFEK